MAHKYRDLIVWRKAVTLAQDVYRITQRFPKVEIYEVLRMLNALISKLET